MHLSHCSVSSPTGTDYLSLCLYSSIPFVFLEYLDIFFLMYAFCLHYFLSDESKMNLKSSARFSFQLSMQMK